MNKMIQIRNVPDALHRKLKERAVKRGTTVTEYIKNLIERDLALLTPAEIAERLRRRKPVKLDPPPEVLIREDRDSR